MGEDIAISLLELSLWKIQSSFLEFYIADKGFQVFFSLK